jgi:hypothetical protein
MTGIPYRVTSFYVWYFGKLGVKKKDEPFNMFIF